MCMTAMSGPEGVLHVYSLGTIGEMARGRKGEKDEPRGERRSGERKREEGMEWKGECSEADLIKCKV